ncbi:MAG: hypothetical protein Q4C63_03115 [Eubacteriales bacterium]|nr:hypothetical protein [Eubacteriales bacterium]
MNAAGGIQKSYRFRFVPRFLFILFCVFGGIFRAPFGAYAAGSAITPVMAEEDVGNGYRYVIPGIGEFTINGLMGERFQAAVFDLPEGLSPVLYRDGEITDFSDGLVIDEGSYELYLYRDVAHEGDYGVFPFSVDSTYENFLGNAEPKEVERITDPSLTVTYDTQSGRFRYELPDGKGLTSNVPLGGYFRGEAVLTADEGLNVYQVYRDGVLAEIGGELRFDRVGSYEIVLRDNEFGLDGDVSYQLNFCFTLYLERRMNLSHLNTPAGLSLISAARDDRLFTPRGDDLQSGFLHLTEDGTYRLLYADARGMPCWQMEFVRDTRPPGLIFSEEIDERKLSESVRFTIPEPDTKLRIYRNGAEVTASQDSIGVNGVYRIEAEDAAGNMQDYNFELQIRYELSPAFLLIIPLALLLFAGVGIIYYRRHMSVI